MGLARRVMRNTLVQLGGEAVGKLATLVFYVVMARSLGVGAFGDFTFALALTMLLLDFAGLGTNAIIARETARDPASVHHLFWNALALVGCLSLLATGLALAVVVAGDYSRQVVIVVILLSVALSIEAAGKNVYATFQGLEDMRPVAAARLLQRLVTAGVGIGALAAGVGVVTVAAIYVGGSILALAWAGRALLARGVRPRPRLSRQHARRLALDALPVGLAGGIGTVLFRVDTTLLSFMKGNDVVGVYGAAYRLLDATLFISFYFVASMVPVLSRLHERTRPSLGEAYGAGVKVLTALLAPVAGAFILFAGPLIETLYGDSYAGAASALQLLGLTAVIYPIGYLSGYLLVGQGRQGVTPWVTGTATVVNIGLNLLFIPRYSLLAAAAITTLSQALLTVGMTALALRSSGPISVSRIALGPAVGCAAMVAAAWLTGATLAGLILALAAYAACLLAFERAVYPADLRLLAGALRGRGLGPRRDSPAVSAES